MPAQVDAAEYLCRGACIVGRASRMRRRNSRAAPCPKRLNGSSQSVFVDFGALPVRSLYQESKVRAGQRLLEYALQGPPHAELAGDSDNQKLELDQSAERRVADELPIRFQPTELLGGPRRRLLGAIHTDVKLGH